MPEPTGIPLGLYVHLPWCLQKCPYCDFNSHALSGTLPEQDYLRALLEDLELAARDVRARQFESVYFGGGTPSLFTAASIGRFLSAVDRAGLLSPDAEISLEANPGTADLRRFEAFRVAGVNRLSIGVQSFDDASLRALGRVHDGVQAAQAVELAVSGFDQVNLDLMYGLPAQTPELAAYDLDRAIESGVSHISCYQLTIEPNTVFAKYPPKLPDEDVLAQIDALVQARLDEAGYRHYEVSAHAKPGHECRHNLNYWSFGDYIGLGAGAHSKLTVDGRVLRVERVRVPETYMRRAGSADVISKVIGKTAQELLFEFMLNALRLRAGFSLDLLRERTGLEPGLASPGLARAQSRGLLLVEDGHVRLTALGHRFLNQAVAEFLPA
ncbi:MAG TPA: radical SAM family heme chaperone HemW [Chromatiales bacterium]|nr:radical SAM family heme chaperone HemW [Chromatiales bacterium]